MLLFSTSFPRSSGGCLGRSWQYCGRRGNTERANWKPSKQQKPEKCWEWDVWCALQHAIRRWRCSSRSTVEQDLKLKSMKLKSRQRLLKILYTLPSSSGHKALVMIPALWESLRYPGVLSVKWSKITGFTYPVRTPRVANRGKMIGGPVGNRVNEQETDWTVYNLSVFSQ